MDNRLPLRAGQTVSEWESGFASPATASTIYRLSPFDLRNLAFPDNPDLGDGPVIRSIHSQGRLLLWLRDVSRAARGLADGRFVP